MGRTLPAPEPSEAPYIPSSTASVFVCLYVLACITAYMWKSGYNLQELVHSSNPMRPNSYPQSHLDVVGKALPPYSRPGPHLSSPHSRRPAFSRKQNNASLYVLQ